MAIDKPVEPTDEPVGPRVVIPVHGPADWWDVNPIYGTLEQRDHWDESIWH